MRRHNQSWDGRALANGMIGAVALLALSFFIEIQRVPSLLLSTKREWMTISPTGNILTGRKLASSRRRYPNLLRAGRRAPDPLSMWQNS